jgi:hypothetical protein
MTNRPDMAAIASRQNVEEVTRLQCAARRLYLRSGRLEAVGRGVSIVFALAAPITALFNEPLALYLAALAGLWLFVSRLLLQPEARRAQRRAASLSDRFDSDVFGLGISPAGLVSDEEVSSLSQGRPLGPYRDWYPSDTVADWPASVLICQRSSAVWSRRQHEISAYIIAAEAFLVFCAGVVLALVTERTLGAYLSVVLLPSLPVLLDCAELARAQLGASKSRARVERRVDSQLDNVHRVSNRDLRANLIELGSIRAGDARSPTWLYRILRSQFERDMIYVAGLRGDSP